MHGYASGVMAACRGTVRFSLYVYTVGV